MKKLIAVSAVAALAATALSAEITFGSWGRALWVTAANGGYTEKDADGKESFKSEIVTDVHQSWGGDAPRNGLSVRGDSDNVGFHLDIGANGNEAWLPGDNCNIWVKPIDIVKVTVGRIDENVLRGDCVNGLWNWDRIGCVGGDEGWTFEDYLDAEGNGVSIVATPAEGLTLGAGVPLFLKDGEPVAKDNKHTLAGAWSKGAAYVGAYNIEGVGTVKAALKTLPKTDDDKSHVGIGAAFDLTSVENLFVSVGAKIDTAEKTAKVVNAYARYGVNEQLTVHARVGTQIGKNYKNKDGEAKEGGFGFLAGAGVDYALDGGIGLFADVRYANGIYNKGSEADKSDNLTLGAGVTKGFSNGVIGVAFEGSTNNGGRYQTNEKSDGFSWEIPVRFEYWF